MKFLYGASVQGVQEFIFKTNKLQEIVGASEIIKKIESEFLQNYKSLSVLRKAGGSIKAIFEEDECRRITEAFPKKIMQLAYGITISQAVVKIDGDFSDPKKAEKELERLLRIQRNKPTVPLDSTLGIMNNTPSTSKPTVKYRKIKKKNTPIDNATKQKLDAYDAFLKNNPRNKEFGDISSFSNEKNKVAIIHADGNGLGQLVPKLGDKLSKFSESLEKATQKAFDNAREDHMDIRDVILGGDDMVIICNANNALEFTKNFLTNFEAETAQIDELKEHTDKLTACAGIAYCNEKYPFHYAVSLAEELCSQAKKASNREASCLMFHNIQSSNFQSWSKFVEDELSIKNDKETIRCDFGPYYLESKNNEQIGDFLNTLKAYRCNGSPIGRLRAWIGELGKSQGYADNMLRRINEIAEQNSEWNSCIMGENLKRFNPELSNEKLIIEQDGIKKTPIYDVLQVMSATEAK